MNDWQIIFAKYAAEKNFGKKIRQNATGSQGCYVKLHEKKYTGASNYFPKNWLSKWEIRQNEVNKLINAKLFLLITPQRTSNFGNIFYAKGSLGGCGNLYEKIMPVLPLIPEK